MADTILTLRQIEDIFQTVTMQILGLPESDADGHPINQDKVRIAWPTGGAPAWKINDDVVFLRIVPVDDPFARQRDVGYSDQDSFNTKKSVNYSRVHQVQWTCYGPNSFDNIETIRNGIFLQEFREQFKKKNLFLVADVGMPQRIPELFNGQWWERCDLIVRYNEGVERSNTVPKILGIKIKTVTDKEIQQTAEGYISTMPTAAIPR